MFCHQELANRALGYAWNQYTFGMGIYKIRTSRRDGYSLCSLDSGVNKQG
jgi:hypothetical protein